MQTRLLQRERKLHPKGVLKIHSWGAIQGAKQ